MQWALLSPIESVARFFCTADLRGMKHEPRPYSKLLRVALTITKPVARIDTRSVLVAVDDLVPFAGFRRVGWAQGQYTV